MKLGANESHGCGLLFYLRPGIKSISRKHENTLYNMIPARGPQTVFLTIFGDLGHLVAARVELPGLVQTTDAREGPKAIFLAHPARAGPDYRCSRGPEGNFLVHLRAA